MTKRHLSTPFLLVCSLFALLGAIGCGSVPTQLGACKHFCDKQGSCTNAGGAAVTQCKAMCDANKTAFDDNDTLIDKNCANAVAVKQTIFDCYGDFCDTTLAENCANAAAQNKCEAK